MDGGEGGGVARLRERVDHMISYARTELININRRGLHARLHHQTDHLLVQA